MSKCIMCGQPYSFAENWNRRGLARGGGQTCSDSCLITFAKLSKEKQDALLLAELERLNVEIARKED